MKEAPVAREKKPWSAYLASFILNDMTGACKKRRLEVAACGISPSELSYLLRLNWEDHIDRKVARTSLEFMLDKADAARKEVDGFLRHVKQKLEEQTANKEHP